MKTLFLILSMAFVNTGFGFDLNDHKAGHPSTPVPHAAPVPRVTPVPQGRLGGAFSQESNVEHFHNDGSAPEDNNWGHHHWRNENRYIYGGGTTFYYPGYPYYSTSVIDNPIIYSYIDEDGNTIYYYYDANGDIVYFTYDENGNIVYE